MLLSDACVVCVMLLNTVIPFWGQEPLLGGDAFGLGLSCVHVYACDIQGPLKSKQPVDLCVWYCAVVCVCVYKQVQAHTESAVCLHDTCVNTERSNKKANATPAPTEPVAPPPPSLPQ